MRNESFASFMKTLEQLWMNQSVHMDHVKLDYYASVWFTIVLSSAR